MGEMIKTNKDICKSCKYSCAINAGTMVVCDFFLVTGSRRGCKVGECDKYEKGKRIKSALKL